MVSRQGRVFPPFLPCVCHPRTRGVCTNAGSGPSRVGHCLLSSCLGDPISLAMLSSIFVTARTSLFTNYKISGLPTRAKYRHNRSIFFFHSGAVPAAPPACVARSSSLSRDKSCPPVPPAQLRLSRVSRALHAASVAPPPPGDAPGPSAPSAPASEAPCAAEASSNSDDDWDALLDAHGLAPPPGGAAAAVAQPAHAAGASRRARDKRRRCLRKAAKSSMWREI